MSQIRREFLPPTGPLIHAATTRILSWYQCASRVDLSGVVVVVPAAAAGKLLLQRLVATCEETAQDLSPPQIVTVGNLPELLYPSSRPFAEETMQLFAWATVLRETPRERLSHLLAVPPASDEVEGWLELAASLQGVHRELASEILSMRSVAERTDVHQTPADQRRWMTLADIQDRYLRLLDSLGYWDRQTARSFAIDHHECRTDRELVLLAAVDLNQSMRRMLAQVAQQVRVLQFSQQEDELLFDEVGCLREEIWSARDIPLTDVELAVVDGPADQAAAALEFINAHAATVSRESLSIGMPDEKLLPYLERQADRYGLSVSSAGGIAATRLPVFRFLECLLDWLGTRSFRALAALVRHPLVFDRVSHHLANDAWLGDLDEYQGKHLPASLEVHEIRSDEPVVAQIVSLVDSWCAALGEGQTRAIDNWARPWLDTVAQFLGDHPLDRDDAHDRGTLRVLEALRDEWTAITQIPAQLQPRLDAVRAQRWVLRRIAGTRIVPLPEAGALPLVGWLELPWDDTTHSIVLSFNEGSVPAGEPNDPLLPNALRRKLGIMHAGRRFGRDAYYLSLLASSRRCLKLVAARRDATGDPLVPGRLWFADRPAVVASRALAAFDQAPLSYRDAEPTGIEVQTKGAWSLTRPDPNRHPASLTPTDFRRYLECPYRFYLDRVCRLGVSDDRADELDPGGFGDLMHEVLANFGRSDLRDCEDASALRARFDALLDDLVTERFSAKHLPAVDLQIEQLRLRLSGFAEHQAAWAAEGWRIEAVETTFKGKSLEVGATKIPIVGRIDRIDRHRDGDRRALLDYKSSEAGRKPEDVHLSKGNWIDLQLPLYHWLVQDQKEKGSLQVGFVVLGKDLGLNGFRLASWTKSEIDAAMKVAEEIAAKIWRGEYWPPNELPKRLRAYDPYDALLTMPSSRVAPSE